MAILLWPTVYGLMFNIIGIGTMYLCQQYESKHGMIPERGSTLPGTQTGKFKYMFDFWSHRLDILSMSGVFIALFHTNELGVYEAWHSPVSFAAGLLAALLFAGGILRDPMHAEDWGFPKPGSISLGGLAHLIYIATAVHSGGMTLLPILFGDLYWLGTPAILLYAGLVVYGFSMIWDGVIGNFDPRPIPYPQQD